MQLLLNRTSPFARVARIAALEAGLGDRLELVWCDPWVDDPALLSRHPSGRVPLLVTDEGAAIAESMLIVQYLDRRGAPGRLLPLEAEPLAATLQLGSIAYALMEAAFQTMISRKHEGAAADGTVMGQRRLAAIARCLQQLENQVPQLPGVEAAWRLDAIVVAVALAYLQFRLPEVVLPAGLAAWSAAVAGRSSLAQTDFRLTA